MRRAYPATIAFGIAITACDPGYEIGARVRLGPPAPDSCILRSLRRSLGQAPFEAADLRPGSGAEVRVPMSILSTRSDSTLSIQANSQLVLQPQKDSTLSVEVNTTWMGIANRYPVAEQRSYVAAATSVLDSLRAACAPESAAKVECIARGLGGHKACEAGG